MHLMLRKSPSISNSSSLILDVVSPHSFSPHQCRSFWLDVSSDYAQDISRPLNGLHPVHCDFINGNIHWQFLVIYLNFFFTWLYFYCLHSRYLLIQYQWGMYLVKCASLMGSMLPPGRVKGRIYSLLLLLEALGTLIVFLWDLMVTIIPLIRLDFHCC